MMITSNDLLAILRRFDVANDDNFARHIDQIKQSNPSPINQLVSFRFERNRYFVLLDETAEDRSDYIMQQIFTAKSDAEGEKGKAHSWEIEKQWKQRVKKKVLQSN